jgi:acyl-CoA synthetase (AMP-forming)/AMP-acid ligase II
MLDALTGRVVEVLRNSRGEQIDPGYFIWIMAEKVNNGVLKKGQIVQEQDGAITVNLLLGPGASQEQAQPHLESIREAISRVMGPDCPVRFVFPDDIPLSASGKFPYIVQRKTLDSTSPAP